VVINQRPQSLALMHFSKRLVWMESMFSRRTFSGSFNITEHRFLSSLVCASPDSFTSFLHTFSILMTSQLTKNIYRNLFTEDQWDLIYNFVGNALDDDDFNSGDVYAIRSKIHLLFDEMEVNHQTTPCD